MAAPPGIFVFYYHAARIFDHPVVTYDTPSNVRIINATFTSGSRPVKNGMVYRYRGHWFLNLQDLPVLPLPGSRAPEALFKTKSISSWNQGWFYLSLL
jgi:hypothetical protein